MLQAATGHVGHDNAQLAFVYDLDTYQQQPSILFPPGHYPRSFAESGKALLAVVRNLGGGPAGVIDRIDLLQRKATQLPSLGVFTNSVNPNAVLTEVLQILYSLFIPAVLVVAYFLWKQKKIVEFRYYAFLIALGFLASYRGALLVVRMSSPGVRCKSLRHKLGHLRLLRRRQPVPAPQ